MTETEIGGSTSLDFIEGGVYFQLVTVGIYVGWNDNSDAFAFGGFHQLSAGVANFASGGVEISRDGIEWVKNAGGGVATPTGLETVVTGAAFLAADGSTLVQTGVGWTDLLEGGIYFQGHIPFTDLSNYVSGDPDPVSAALEGLASIGHGGVGTTSPQVFDPTFSK